MKHSLLRDREMKWFSCAYKKISFTKEGQILFAHISSHVSMNLFLHIYMYKLILN